MLIGMNHLLDYEYFHLVRTNFSYDNAEFQYQ